jgi:hypothetical protein
MTHCDYCDKKIDGLPFHCRRCGKYFCSKHRLPEDHNCPGLKQGNIFDNLSDNRKKYSHRKTKKHYYDVDEEHKNEYVGTSQKTNKTEKAKEFINSARRTYYKIKNTLLRPIRKFSFENLFKGFFKIPLLVGLLIIWLIISKIVNSLFLEIGYSIEPYGFLSFILFYAILFFAPIYLIYRFFTDMPHYKKFSYIIGGILSLIVISYALSWAIPQIPDTTFEREFYVPNSASSIEVEMNEYQYLFYTSLNKAHFMNWISQFTIFDEYLFKKNLPADIIQSLKEKYPSKTDDQLVRDVVSLVQNLDYDYSKLDSLSFQVRFPYETLYDEKGVCIEKSLLLLRLLEELNYNTALLTFYGANHAGVGIQCNKPNYEEFCFIESTNSFAIGEVPPDLRGESPSITRYGGLKRYTK